MLEPAELLALAHVDVAGKIDRPSRLGIQHHVEEMQTDARDQDLAVPIVIPENLGDLADHLHPFLPHVVEPSDERAHVLGPRLRREDRLIRGEDERRVNPDAFRRQGLNRLEPFRRHLNLHYHVLVKLRELAALFDHLLRLSRRDLEGDRAVDEGEDVGRGGPVVPIVGGGGVAQQISSMPTRPMRRSTERG